MNFKMSFLFLETFKKEKKKEKKKKRKLKHPPLRIDKRQLRSPFDFIFFRGKIGTRLLSV